MDFFESHNFMTLYKKTSIFVNLSEIDKQPSEQTETTAQINDSNHLAVVRCCLAASVVLLFMKPYN